jgi:hypothetical protein
MFPNMSLMILVFPKKSYDSQSYQVKEILEDVFMTANNLDISYELEGKSIDDK